MLNPILFSAFSTDLLTNGVQKYIGLADSGQVRIFFQNRIIRASAEFFSINQGLELDLKWAPPSFEI